MKIFLLKPKNKGELADLIGFPSGVIGVWDTPYEMSLRREGSLLSQIKRKYVSLCGREYTVHSHQGGKIKYVSSEIALCLEIKGKWCRFYWVKGTIDGRIAFVFKCSSLFDRKVIYKGRDDNDAILGKYGNESLALLSWWYISQSAN